MAIGVRLFMPLFAVAALGAVPLRAQAALEQPVTLVVTDVPLREALLQLRRAGVPLAWRGDLLPGARRVTVAAQQLPVRSVLGTLLAGTLLTARTTRSGTIVLVPGIVEETLALERTALASGIQALDQLVITGSAVGRSAERELPTATSLVDHVAMRESPHGTLGELLRAFLPGLVLWDRGGAGPIPSLAGVRGAASFTARAPKTYVDGIEVASSELFTLLDPRAIERIEMIHGPQGAALYGPDALAGVVNIDTHKAPPGRGAWHADVEGALGVHSRSLDGASLTRHGAVRVGSRGAAATAVLHGALARLDNSTPLAEDWRGHLGAAWRGSRHRLEVTARAAEHRAPLERIGAVGQLLTARPAEPLVERGVGARLTHATTAAISQVLVAGVHHVSGPREPFRSPLLPPVLPLGATNETATRWSARWAITLEHSNASVTVGAEASHRDLARVLRRDGNTPDLTVLHPVGLDTRGALAQARWRVAGLVLSGGARVDRISSLGGATESPWAATIGASWNTQVGEARVRLRAAWGRAIRSPEAGMGDALAAGSIRQEANPLLTAERQAGWEGGIELHWGEGAWVRVTGFAQRARNLIQQVDLRRTVAGQRLYQFQNVGALTNRGLELDGGATRGIVSAAGRLHLVQSRVADLAPGYAGEFEVGDRPLEVPSSQGSLAVRVAPTAGLRLEVGGTWIGPWRGYDWRLIQRVEAGQSPLRDRAREYWRDYAGVVRPFAGVGARLGPQVQLRIRAEWPVGDSPWLRDNLTPPAGRTVVVAVGVTL